MYLILAELAQPYFKDLPIIAWSLLLVNCVVALFNNLTIASYLTIPLHKLAKLKVNYQNAEKLLGKAKESDKKWIKIFNLFDFLWAATLVVTVILGLIISTENTYRQLPNIFHNDITIYTLLGTLIVVQLPMNIIFAGITPYSKSKVKIFWILDSLRKILYLSCTVYVAIIFFGYSFGTYLMYDEKY